MKKPLFACCLLASACGADNRLHVDWAPHDVMLLASGVEVPWTPSGYRYEPEDPSPDRCLELEARAPMSITVEIKVMQAVDKFCVRTEPRVPVERSMEHGTFVNHDVWKTNLDAGGRFVLCGDKPPAKYLPCD